MEKNNVTQNPRETALLLIERLERRGAFTDRVLASPEVNAYDSRDRRFIREAVTGVVRHKLRLDRIIGTYYTKRFESLEPFIIDVLRLGLYQMMFMDSVPDWAAVNESANIASRERGRGASGLVNALLRRFGREGEPPLPEDPIERITVEMSHPQWLVERWVQTYGVEEAGRIAGAGAARHPVHIRLREGRITAESLRERLSEEGFGIDAIPGMDGYFSVDGGTGLFETQTFMNGLFTVQDPSAGLAVRLLAPTSADNVLDLCAAPGGKATQCAEMMGDEGCVTAVDINRKRLGLVREAAGRLGLGSIRYAEGDAGSFGGDGVYDKVLLDAPCTGTAVFSKRPDMKWRLESGDIERLSRLQKGLLENAARLVEPRGVLVYSTCSLEPEENDDNIAWFLDTHPEFTADYDSRFAAFRRGNGYLIPPYTMGGAGAFAAKLIRTDTT